MTTEFVQSFATAESLQTDWGELRWLVDDAQIPGAQQTLGVVRINPACANPLHAHPNCEELLYVLEGTCSHRLGDAAVALSPGDAIRIPAGTAHCAQCTSDAPLLAVISFSSGRRETVTLESPG